MRHEFDEVRDDIAELDLELIEILAERMRAVGKLAHLKDVLGLSIEDPEREARLGAFHRQAALRRGLCPSLTDRIFRLVMSESKSLQRRASA